jgi:Spy/CpxP family protein refolding chaperone
MNFKVLLAVIVLFTSAIHAQPGKEKRDRVKALKVSFITTELGLTSEESAKFWPVYNAFDEKQFEIRHNRMREIIKKLDQTGIDKLSEKEANSYLTQLEDAETDLLNLKKKLVADLRPVIGPVRILKLKKAEEDFNRKLISQIRDKRK